MIPPRKKSEPFGESGLTTSCARANTSWNVAPPSRDSHSPSRGAPGGVKRPPEVDESPCRATAVPMRMWFGFDGFTAMPPMPRFAAAARLPGTSVQWLPPSVER